MVSLAAVLVLLVLLVKWHLAAILDCCVFLRGTIFGGF